MIAMKHARAKSLFAKLIKAAQKRSTTGGEIKQQSMSLPAVSNTPTPVAAAIATQSWMFQSLNFALKKTSSVFKRNTLAKIKIYNVEKNQKSKIKNQKIKDQKIKNCTYLYTERHLVGFFLAIFHALIKQWVWVT